jgi:hypothetical protein
MSPLEISASSIAPTARAWLTNTHEASVLHVFDRACNLINERREVLSIVTPHIGNGPFNLVVEDDVLFSTHLHIETAMFIHADQLQLGNLIINTTSAKLWCPRPDWEELHAKRDDILDQLTLLPITNYEVRGLDTPSPALHQTHDLLSKSGASVAASAQGYSTTGFNPKLPIIAKHPFGTKYLFSNSLISSFTTTDLPTSLTAARKLAGLGPGLTPAGDDFILGAILAAWIIHPREIASVIAQEIANTAAPLTTSLSAAWLRSAGGGETGILWHQFFDALISSDPVRIHDAMDKILAVGETSGADAMAGFIGFFIYWGEHCSNLWEYNQT